ncbi:LPXTG cell wall anchor domain-containing protein [Brevibacterium sp. p3-SID960]|uniref:LPXTG cell wall anchor domain-containing protein n=1 Tax=Brevibacterium sp. p3-SID960 TaxID=2916063 RepID=UPI0021A392DF|nr:LPXTG cell wall anchor domain-containing protein [Brevibacterium sp. p3-SID960]MCT1691730.1 LPXTG cell wall anchor domain-containing protein [Brevibacterium sp. p3-SID960]
MKTSKSLVLAPAVAVAVSGMFAVPAVASTSTAPDSPPSQGETKKPEATVESETVTQSDIADKDKGIKFSGSGFDGDKTARVVVTGTDGTTYEPDQDLTVNDKGEVNGSYFFTTTGGAKVPLGAYKLELVGNDTKTESTEVTFTVVSDSESPAPTPPTETPSETPNATPTETPSETSSAPPTETPPKPEIGKIKPRVTDVDEKTFLDKGIEFTGEGFTADLKTTVTVEAPAENGKAPQTAEAAVTTDKDGKLAFTIKGARTDDALATPARGDSDSPLETAVKSGTYTVEVKAEGAEKSARATFDVTAAATEEPPPTGTPSPSDSPSATSDPSQSATPSDTPSATPSETPSETTTPSKSPVPTGQPTESDDKKAAPKLTIDPLEIASADFGKDGVKIIGENFKPGQKITMVVNHAQGKVKQYTTEVTADDNGVAAFRVRAVTTPVLGQYNVTVHPSDAAADGDQALHGSFTVITNGSSVGDETTGDTKKDTSGGTDLPRTGAELTGLAMGAGLLVIGAAAVVITRRRTAGGNGPADI